MPRYFILYKPFDVLSQFTKEVPSHKTLGDCFDFPKDVYPVGRLDRDSEGLLVLTDDKKINQRLLDPKFKHSRIYYAQVEGIPTENDLYRLHSGVRIRVNKKIYTTLPAQATLMSKAPALPERDPPIRFRQNIPTSWIKLTLTEGKNRQVRKMCAKIGFPVLRLVRFQIGQLQLAELLPGEVKEMTSSDIHRQLGL